jgi:hypothetical protein
LDGAAPLTALSQTPDIADWFAARYYSAASARPEIRAIAVQSIDDKDFRTELEAALRRPGRERGKVPIAEIKSLFDVGDAAPARPVRNAVP